MVNDLLIMSNREFLRQWITAGTVHATGLG